MPVVSQSTRHFNVVGFASTTADPAAAAGSAPAPVYKNSSRFTAGVSAATGAVPSATTNVSAAGWGLTAWGNGPWGA